MSSTTTPTTPTSASAPARWPQPDRVQRQARLAGLLYLVVLVTGAPPELFVRADLRAAGDATAVAEAIRASSDLVRLAALSDLINMVAFLGVALVLYGLLRHLHAGAARAFLAFNALSVGIMALNTVNHVAALLLATREDLRAALGATAADALAASSLELHGVGFSIAEVFFGLWLVPLGWVLWRHRAVPQWLGVFLVVGGVGYLANVTATFVSPTLTTSLTPVLTTPSALAETSLLVWLLVKGLRLDPR